VHPLRRLFSLAGVLPLGVFLLEHAALCTAALGGQHAFASALRVLASPSVHAAHVALVWMPLAFHGAYGFHLLVRRLPLREPSPYPPRARALVRWTSWVVLAFLALHVYECRLASSGAFERGEITYSHLSASLSSLAWGVPWRGLFYLVGLAATVVHFGWGLWAYLVSSGWAQVRAFVASAATLVVLFVVGAGAVVSFATGSHAFYVPLDRGPNADVPCPSASP
jgi:succinate dehydrogenase cytochrome b subunit